MWLNVDTIVQTGGILAVALVIFAETGLLMGFFLPGDTLLIAAGLFAGQGKLPLILLLPITAIAAIAGYQVGYLIGERAGPRLFRRQGGVLFRADYVPRTENFFKKHGAITILLIRFVAVARTIIPLIAGIGKMDKRKFVFYNIVGAVLWTFSITLAAYWVGKKVPNVDKIIIPLVLAAIILTTGSVLFELLKSAERRRALRQALREELAYFFRRKNT